METKNSKMAARAELGGSAALPKYLSPVAVWALSFGCAVGWGSFVMPGTTFLPTAGPVGSLLGLLIGAAIMFVIGVNYHWLMNRYPGPGGAYTYAKKALGSDHGFLCAWLLLLTYVAIIWANSTALSLIMRYLFGDLFCFGFSYTIAGYTVYFGEVLLSVAVLALTCGVCMVGRRLVSWVQTALALILLLGVVVCFVGVLIHGNGLSALEPAYAANDAPVAQIFAIVILAPRTDPGLRGPLRRPRICSFDALRGGRAAGGLFRLAGLHCRPWQPAGHSGSANLLQRAKHHGQRRAGDPRSGGVRWDRHRADRQLRGHQPLDALHGGGQDAARLVWQIEQI